MNKLRKFSLLLVSAPLLLTATPALAMGCCGSHEGHGSTTAVSQDTDAYPLTTCVVSGDKLEDGEMGPPIDYVYKQEGKPDRLVRLCCKSCIKKFNKDPQKYLKMIDDAAAGNAAAPAEAPAGHSGHAH
jgi:hypothetical protein